MAGRPLDCQIFCLLDRRHQVRENAAGQRLEAAVLEQGPVAISPSIGRPHSLREPCANRISQRNSPSRILVHHADDRSPGEADAEPCHHDYRAEIGRQWWRRLGDASWTWSRA